MSTSNSNRLFISHLPLFFLSLYIVDRSAFSHRSPSIRGFHLVVLETSSDSCVCECLEHRTVSELDQAFSMDRVSSRRHRLYKHSRFPRTISVGVMEGIVSFHLSLQLDSILHHASPPVVFVSLYSRQERFFTPYPPDSRISPLRVEHTAHFVCFRVVASPCRFSGRSEVAYGPCFRADLSSLHALAIPADDLGWSTWESRFISPGAPTRIDFESRISPSFFIAL